MNIRPATEADLPTLETLWRAFESEVPEQPYLDHDPDEELREIAEIVRGEVALLAEDDGGAPLGFALARRRGSRLARLTDLYVVPDARRARRRRAPWCGRSCRPTGRRGWSTSISRCSRRTPLRARCTGAGASARTCSRSWPRSTASRASSVRRASGETFGSIHVQTDDTSAVERAVRQFVPRLPGHSRGSDRVRAAQRVDVRSTTTSATATPQMLRRLAQGDLGPHRASSCSRSASRRRRSSG